MSEKKKLELTVKELTTQNADLQSENADLISDKNKSESTLADLTSKNDELQSDKRELTIENESLKTEIESLKRKGSLSYFLSLKFHLFFSIAGRSSSTR